MKNTMDAPEFFAKGFMFLILMLLPIGIGLILEEIWPSFGVWAYMHEGELMFVYFVYVFIAAILFSKSG